MADRVRALIAMLAPDGICDPCLAERLGFASEEEAAQATRALAGEDGYERRKQSCAICRESRVATRRNLR